MKVIPIPPSTGQLHLLSLPLSSSTQQSSSFTSFHRAAKSAMCGPVVNFRSKAVCLLCSNSHYQITAVVAAVVVAVVVAAVVAVGKKTRREENVRLEPRKDGKQYKCVVYF